MTIIGTRLVLRACLAGLIAGTFLLVFGQAQAATIKAASPSRADVGTAVAAAADGDTVIVPAGTASWTATLEVTKGITIQGATTITGTRDNPNVTDATIILDAVPRTAAASAIVRANLPVGKTFRLTGF